MEKVYAFTNENITSYDSLYNFSVAKVLTVLGSGDQYFSSLLFGASDVELYDINPLTWNYFILKFYSILTLSYDEFYDYFVTKKLDDVNYFNKVKPYLPTSTANKLSNIYRQHQLSSFVKYIDIATLEHGSDINVPYFDKAKYYQLQALLRKRNLPTFYNTNLLKLPEQVSNKEYDIMMTSNILYWIPLGTDVSRIEEYKALLNRFNCTDIQALYTACLSERRREKFEEYGFDIEPVSTAKRMKNFDDYVVSLRKK